MATAPKQLVDSLKNSRCIIFVGSGLSIQAGHPSWSGLVDTLVQEAAGAFPEKAESLKAYAKQQKDPLLVAEYARSKLGPQRYGSLLRSTLTRGAKPTTAHKIIAKTDYRAAITTNYDKLIETAITFERNEPPAVYSWNSLQSLASALFEGQFFVLKLHGDIDNPESIILTSQDYDQVMFRAPFMRTFLQSIFLNFTLLFVGYSLSDPDFQLMLKEVNLIFSSGTPPHYALLADPHEFTMEHLMQRMNIQIISYKAQKDHKEAIDFVKAMQAEKPYAAK